MSGVQPARPLSWRRHVLRGSLIALVMAFMGVLVLLPLAAVFVEALSKGVAEEDTARGNAPEPVPAARFVSRGMTRGRTANASLMLVPTDETARYAAAPAAAPVTVTALKTSTAYKPEPGIAPAAFPAGEVDPLPSPSPAKDAGLLRAEAQMKGYTGDQCTECHNFTMVRNGTCLKCDTCGTTTGCS